MFSIVKEWKEFRVFLPSLAAWVRETVGETFNGLSADYSLTMWYSEEPSDETKTAIDAYWDALTEVGETAKWTIYTNRNLAVEAARTALLTEDLTLTTPAERKILMNLPLTDDDKDALLVKYPQ